MTDATRQHDLEQLAVMRNDQKLSRNARHEVEETIHKVANQSSAITEVRQRLVNATRGGDTKAIEKFQSQIHHIRQRETNGREF